jgi:hypothetical protein
MKKITINYLSHSRLNYSNLSFYFLSKIKKENKDKIKLNILSSEDYDWASKCHHLDIEYNVQKFAFSNNYLEKIKFALSTDTEYSVKLDEDCFMSNHVWDYMIENIDILNKDNNLILSPTMSNNIPSCDYFINDFISEEDVKDKIYNHFLNRAMPNGLWGVDYTNLNKYTIDAEKWDYKNFYDGISKLNTPVKGIHPLRISYEAEVEINDYIVKNVNKFTIKNNYSFFEINSPYFTNSLFFIKTTEWINILKQPLYDSFDEIALNNYKKEFNKKVLFIKNGFAIHPMFNTVCGDSTGNPWGIGGPNAQIKEFEFVNKLEQLIIN